MVGSGTTLIEAKLLNRNAIGIDINPNAIELTKKAIEFEVDAKAEQKVFLGDARSLIDIADNSIDLIIFHPPYYNIIKYSDKTIKEDLSSISRMEEFFFQLEIIVKELFRVLKPNKYCAVLIGDTRKAQHYIPLSHYLLQKFLINKFLLKEEIIKSQHNCKYSQRWSSKASSYNFYLIMHEHLFIFRKPLENEDLTRLKWSAYNKLNAI